MIGLSLLITTFLSAQPLWRGAVNVGLGMALVASSLVYLKAIMQKNGVTAPPVAEEN